LLLLANGAFGEKRRALATKDFLGIPVFVNAIVMYLYAVAAFDREIFVSDLNLHLNLQNISFSEEHGKRL